MWRWKRRPTRGEMLAREFLASIALVILVCALAVASDSEAVHDRHVAARGQIMFVRPADFGLAVHRDQLLVKTVIPPCDDTFDYCLYYYGDDFAGTNFQSAGVRIERRAALHSVKACLFTPPRGYVDFEPTVRRKDAVAVSVFAPLQQAGMGHFSEGMLFRLAFEDTCYEVETRIGMSQAAHYAEGTVREFTEEERAVLTARLDEVVRAVRLVDDPDIVLFKLLETRVPGPGAQRR